MLDATVLVIEPSDANAQLAETLLRFLEIEPVRVRNLAELRADATVVEREWLAVMIARPTAEAAGVELVDFVRSMPRPMPIICLGNGGAPHCAADATDLNWLTLDQPIRQRCLSAVLEEAAAFRAGRETGKAGHRYRPGGRSRVMAAVNRLIEQVAPFDTNVLILGESGTGKEMAARHIHELSGRKDRPFVPVNCGAIPADLLESELFGHEKGAFTGALTARVGRFEYAEGGTLFLDEIGDMSLQMQVKLLRVLQERSFERVGSNRTIHCNVRIIAATHRNLEEAIVAGRFREDLFYRLNVFPLQMPPLRDRLDDLPVLIDNLLDAQAQGGARRIRLDSSAVRRLAGCRWPGNVRELSNLLERLAILYPGQMVGAQDLPDRYRGSVTAEVAEAIDLQSLYDAPRGDQASSCDEDLPSGGIDLKDHLSAIELGLIRKALKEADGTVAEAARLLHMRRTTLVEKLRKYQLSA
ncbi:MAG: sigma-54-dependent Fis family transcriptional regulator [Gammaproteobacteria bacterium]|nr:sigma-54-dependent Fis family transcriptional regulator [Gammaproteobacteria bacterium]